jgi:hypothetical protein
MTTVHIRENFKTVYKTNPISGHTWPEAQPTTSFSVIGAVGKSSTHKTLLAAQKTADGLQAFYDKFDL